ASARGYLAAGSRRKGGARRLGATFPPTVSGAVLDFGSYRPKRWNERGASLGSSARVFAQLGQNRSSRGDPMAIVAGFDVHRRQITLDALDTDTGEVERGRIPATPEAVRHWA